jgi:hypothetical protein
MAVADVGVAMGPRNQRRLTAGSVTLGGVLAIAVVALWLFGGGLPLTHATHQSGTPVARHLTLIPDRLVYGMTEPQVLHKIGQPERIAGNCWQYHEGVRNFVGQTVNAVRVCFFDNTYSTSYYMEIDGKWRDPSSSRLVIAPPTQ